MLLQVFSLVTSTCRFSIGGALSAGTVVCAHRAFCLCFYREGLPLPHSPVCVSVLSHMLTLIPTARRREVGSYLTVVFRGKGLWEVI